LQGSAQQSELGAMEEGFRGLYRTTAWAYVSNGLMSFQVIKMDYQRFGYQPDYDQLPWKEDYLATGTPAANLIGGHCPTLPPLTASRLNPAT